MKLLKSFILTLALTFGAVAIADNGLKDDPLSDGINGLCPAADKKRFDFSNHVTELGAEEKIDLDLMVVLISATMGDAWTVLSHQAPGSETLPFACEMLERMIDRNIEVLVKYLAGQLLPPNK